MAKLRRSAPPVDPSAATWRERLERVRATAVSGELSREEIGAELRRRAAAIAAPAESDAPATERGRDILTFQLGGQNFGVDAAAGLEVVRVNHLTPLPGTPAALRGLANIRSRIVPVFELDALLALPRTAETAQRTTVLTLAVEGAEFGILVDAATGLRPVAAAETRSAVSGLQSQFVQSVTADGLVLLDVAALATALSSDERAS